MNPSRLTWNCRQSFIALVSCIFTGQLNTMAATRIKHTYAAHLGDFGTDTLVECPICKRQAIAKTLHIKTVNESAKVICPHCGFNKVYPTFIIPVRLWLTTECEGHLLWARNYEHLDFLKQHVEAFLRERNTTPNSNTSIGSRLPRWMTSKKNRNKVLKCLERLKQKGR